MIQLMYVNHTRQVNSGANHTMISCVLVMVMALVMHYHCYSFVKNITKNDIKQEPTS